MEPSATEAYVVPGGNRTAGLKRRRFTLKGLKLNGLKLFAAGMTVAGMLGLASGSHAADTVVFAGAGSSALWKGFEQSALSSLPNHYSAHNGASIVDGTETEKGDVWIAWDNGASGSITIAYYIKVDSTVGDRAYFRSDTLTIANPAPTADNTGYPGTGDLQPPSEVLNAVNAAAINVGLTDITPADAKVATTRSINQLGYGLANPMHSAYDASTATPIDFNLNARAFTLVPIGASPIMVFVNTSDTTAGGFGTIPTDPSANPDLEFRANIDRFTLSGFLSGQLGRTRDLISDMTLQSGAGKPVTTIIREPLSGTYNTLEYCIPESVAAFGFTGGKGQELGVTTNPKNDTIPATGFGGRKRAIGTGQSILQASNTPNSLAYAFWSFSNFAIGSGKPFGNLRYLTVDGCDPLFDSYSIYEGSLQPGATPSFRNIKNGGYPIWSVLRAVTQSPTPPAVSAIITGLSVGDFVKFTDLEVFRSYHATPDFPAPSNGNYSGTTPTGGDVGGAVFPINADVDFANDIGAELVNLKQ